MNPKVNAKTWFALAIVAVIMGLILFISAGTIHYWQAWVYLALYLGISTLIILYLMKYSPALLERRMRGGPTAEKEPTQRIIMIFTSIGFIGLLVVPGLDHRFGWSHVPDWLVVLGYVLTIVGFYIVFLVFKENSYASATIELASDQRVISTGPYAIVRHPMYAGASLYIIAMPLALGSYWALLVLLLFFPFLIWRMYDEEAFLSKNLPGYDDYRT